MISLFGPADLRRVGTFAGGARGKRHDHHHGYQYFHGAYGAAVPGL